MTLPRISEPMKRPGAAFIKPQYNEAFAFTITPGALMASGSHSSEVINISSCMFDGILIRPSIH